jgi:phosphinothricin acetyltransferase
MRGGVIAMSIEIHPASAEHADAIARIYNHYIATTCVTFETEAVSAAEMALRVAEAKSAELPWLVARDGDDVVGYAYASKWRSRHAYRFSVESTVYLDPARTGQGIGRTLYAALIEKLRTRALHAVIGGIAQPNDASVALHERLGFRKVAHFEEVGFKQGRWVDVGYWQLLL